jgi:hypothetical protein
VKPALRPPEDVHGEAVIRFDTVIVDLPSKDVLSGLLKSPDLSSVVSGFSQTDRVRLKADTT